MNKWFHRIEKRHQVRIFKYLDKLKHVKDTRLKIETLMNKKKWTYEFCAECVEEWNKAQDDKSIREIDDKKTNMELQGGLF